MFYFGLFCVPLESVSVDPFSCAALQVMGPAMEDKSKIVAFDGTGFHNWKFRMETVLDMYGLLDCLQREVIDIDEMQVQDGDTPEVRADKKMKVQERIMQEKKCKSLIVQAIADSQLELIKDCQSPKAIWNMLRNVFERYGVAGQLYVRKQLLTLKYVEAAGISMSEHLLRFDRLIRELKGSGANVEESDAICHLLLTLPASFDSVVTAIETLPGGVSMDFVKKRLLDVDLKRQNRTAEASGSDCVALVSKNSKKKFKCYQCGKIGHKKADCRVAVKENLNEKKFKSKYDSRYAQKANVGVDENPEIAFVAADEDFVKVGWFLDSGATDHMLKESSYFVTMRRMASPIEIVVANGQKLLAEFCGDVEMYLMVNGKRRKCKAHDVLYLPDLSCNLFSVKRVTRAGFTVSFANDKAEISQEGTIYAVGWLKGKLYELDVYCKSNEMGSALVSGKVAKNAMLWHRRYGHVGCDSLQQLVKKDMITGLKLAEFDKDTILCEPCLSGKIAKLPFNINEKRRSSRPLELIHSDVCGQINPPTWDGKRFFVSFIDDYSHFAMIFLISSKDEVLECFRDYEALVTAHLGTRISRFRTDNGGEYMNNAMRAFCREKGIAMEMTVPYTPQQNGVSERMNRTLMERARAILAESGFDKEMWGEAVYTATYITNRCPTSAVYFDKTPYELWTGRRPDVDKLRVFGSTAYMHIPRELRTKIDSKSRKLYMVGYTVNGYRLWDSDQRKVVMARDVVFDESLMFSAKQETREETSKHVILDTYQPAIQKNTPVPEVEEEQEVSENGSEEEQNVSEQDPVVRRSERMRKEPAWYDCYELSCGLALCAESFVENLPGTVMELKKRSDWPKWQEAIADEMDSLIRNKTWTLSVPPAGKNVVDSKWVFKIKRGVDGGVCRYKARLVARGFSQRKGFDYEDTYSPVARLTTLRTLLAVANFEDMHLHQLDVKTAFLNGTLDQDIFMRLPDEFAVGNLVAKLHKSLYGLKQASRAWNERFHKFIVNLGFQRSDADNCLYYASMDSEVVYLIIYVDDILLASGSLKYITKLKELFNMEFEMTDLKEVKTFLGLTIERDRKNGVLKISQKQYLESLLNRFGMGDCKPVDTPLASNLKLTKCIDQNKFTTKPYKELVGCLMYATVTSRPDICVAVNYFSGFQSCATDEHWCHLKRILRYIKGTLDMKLIFRRSDMNGILEGHVDSDWAGDVNDRKSLSGYVFRVYSSTVAWTTRKQTSVALSSAEAEYTALSVAVAEALWLRMLLKDLGRRMDEPIVLMEDNQACIRIAEEEKPTKRLKHVDVRFHFVRNEIQNRVIRLMYVPTENQIADIMTKGIPRTQYQKLRSLLGLMA